MKSNQKSQTAIFDEEMLCWVDGITKENGKKKGLWSYYDIGGELIQQIEYDLLGRVKSEQNFTPKGIDKKATMDKKSQCFIYVLEAPKDKDGFPSTGLMKSWLRCSSDGKVLLKEELKSKDKEEIERIWQNSSWVLSQELYYENGKQIWLKSYDEFGNLELYDESEEEKELEIDKEELKKLVTIQDKSCEQNYKEYVELLKINSENNTDDIQINPKATKQDIQTCEKRLNTALPQELKLIYTEYANGIECDGALELQSTQDISGLVDLFKFMMEGSDDEQWLDTHIYNNKTGEMEVMNEEQKSFIKYLNENYFCFAYQRQDADFIAFLFDKNNNFKAINFSDDYSLHVFNEYFSSIENSYNFENFESLWNGYLDICKRSSYYQIMQELEEEKEDYYESKWDDTLEEIESFVSGEGLN